MVMGQGDPAARKFETTVRARLLAFSVHILTALGAACALLALFAAVEGDWVMMFAWLGLALIIDGFDGALARRGRVAEILPRWSGDVLDSVVDFTTYVFVPAFALATGEVLPDSAAVPLAVAIVVSGAIYFADRQMKTADNYFLGFPALWNAVAFHLFILNLPPVAAAAIVAVLVVLTFVPMKFVHPFRVARLRALTILAVICWSLLGLYALMHELAPGPAVAWTLTAFGLYFFAVGLLPPASTTAREP
jgi:phosphatidylcholine synthase